MTDNPGDTLRRASADGDAVLAVASGTPRLSLDFLREGAYPTGRRVADTDRLSIAGRDYRTQYSRLRTEHPELRNRIYGRTATDSQGRLWLQYWFFYFYNDYHLAGDFGLHEGDWEMIQLRMAEDGSEPDLAAYAQHRYAEVRPWEEVLRAEGRPDTPLVYPGRGSHASYFEPGVYDTEAWFDVVDGRRAAPTPALTIVDDAGPEWTRWPGRWGDTEARIAGLEQPSPEAPCRHPQWRDPALLMVGARSRPTTTPLPHQILALKRSGDHVEIQFDFTALPADDPAERVMVSVNSSDEPDVAPRTFTYSVAGRRRGRLVPDDIILLPDRHYDLHAAYTTRSGLPSSATEVELAPVWRVTLPGRIGRVVGEWWQRLRAAVAAWRGRRTRR